MIPVSNFSFEHLHSKWTSWRSKIRTSSLPKIDNNVVTATNVEEKVEVYQAKVYAIIERENDNEDKLIVVPKNMDFSTEEIEEIVSFQEKFFKYKIVK